MTEGKLIYVDDSESDRVIVSKLWSRATDEEAVLLESGSRLMEYLAACPDEHDWPRVVLLDLNMPGMTGYDVLVAVRADPRLVMIPIIIYSSSASPADIDFCYENHANGYVVKDIDPVRTARSLERLHDFWFRQALTPVRES